jgi:hypothetical protein
MVTVPCIVSFVQIHQINPRFSVFYPQDIQKLVHFFFSDEVLSKFSKIAFISWSKDMILI